MWLFLLLLQSLIGFALAENGLRIHQANAAKLKCDALPFRSMYDGTNCYFAVSTQVPFERGTAICHSIFFGAVMDTTTASRPVLSVIFLDPKTFHNELTDGQSKGVLCKYESSSTCNHDELKEMHGKCLRRLDKTVNFKEAKEHCNSLENSQLVTVSNDDENKVLSSFILENEKAWIDQPLLNQKAGTGDKEKIQYFRWFTGQQCLANNAINIFATKKGSCAKYGYWHQTPTFLQAFAFCVRPSEGDFTPVEKNTVSDAKSVQEQTTTIATTTKKAVPDASAFETAGCSYDLATNNELCLKCEPVTIENIGEGLRASCGIGKLVVFVPKKSTQPRFTDKFLECNLTSAGWSYLGQQAGSKIKMGCTSRKAADLVETGCTWPRRAPCPAGRICWNNYKISTRISPRIPNSGQGAHTSLTCTGPRSDFPTMLYGGKPVWGLICAGGRYRIDLADNSPLQEMVCVLYKCIPMYQLTLANTVHLDFSTRSMRHLNANEKSGLQLECADSNALMYNNGNLVDSSKMWCFNEGQDHPATNGYYMSQSIGANERFSSGTWKCALLRGKLAGCTVPQPSLIDLKCPVNATYCELPYRKFKIGPKFTVTLACRFNGKLHVDVGSITSPDPFCDSDTGEWRDRGSGKKITSVVCAGV